MKKQKPIKIELPANITDPKLFDIMLLLKEQAESRKRIAKYEYLNRQDLQHFVLDDFAEVIEESAFKGCSNLKTVVLSSRILSIGQFAFHGCTKLKRIIVPKEVTHINIDPTAFIGSGISEIRINHITYYVDNNVPDPFDSDILDL